MNEEDYNVLVERLLSRALDSGMTFEEICKRLGFQKPE